MGTKRYTHKFVVTRNLVAVASHNRPAGRMGGSAKANHKRNRKVVRQALKRGDY